MGDPREINLFCGSTSTAFSTGELLGLRSAGGSNFTSDPYVLK